VPPDFSPQHVTQDEAVEPHTIAIITRILAEDFIDLCDILEKAEAREKEKKERDEMKAAERKAIDERKAERARKEQERDSQKSYTNTERR
jgi:hypothetical protein